MVSVDFLSVSYRKGVFLNRKNRSTNSITAADVATMIFIRLSRISGCSATDLAYSRLANCSVNDDVLILSKRWFSGDFTQPTSGETIRSRVSTAGVATGIPQGMAVGNPIMCKTDVKKGNISDTKLNAINSL